MSARRPARLLAAALAGTAALTLGGCGTGAEAGGREEQEVVASFYPLAWLTEQVAGEAWEVSNLTTPGGEPHDLELSIDATARLASADLVVYLDGFQPAVDDAVETSADGAALDAAGVVDLRSLPDGAGRDPHFWLDPERMATLAGAVAGELARLDPAHTETYEGNAERLAGGLGRLDRAYAEGLADCERDVVVVSHDAFGYLEKYGLRLESIAGLSPSAEPTPAVLADLGELVRQEGLTTVFSERLASSALAETLASDLDVRTAVLDPIEGLTDQTSTEDYRSLMRANLEALQEANGC